MVRGTSVQGLPPYQLSRTSSQTLSNTNKRKKVNRGATLSKVNAEVSAGHCRLDHSTHGKSARAHGETNTRTKILATLRRSSNKSGVHITRGPSVTGRVKSYCHFPVRTQGQVLATASASERMQTAEEVRSEAMRGLLKARAETPRKQQACELLYDTQSWSLSSAISRVLLVTNGVSEERPDEVRQGRRTGGV